MGRSTLVTVTNTSNFPAPIGGNMVPPGASITLPWDQCPPEWRPYAVPAGTDQKWLNPIPAFSAAQFSDIGGASSFGVGYVNINGLLYFSDGFGIYQVGQPILKNTVVLLGDSRTAQNDSAGSGNSADSMYRNVQGYWTWAQVLSGHRMTLVKNAGIGGNTASNMRARYKTDVSPYRSAIIIIWSDLNDVAADRTWTSIADDLSWMYDQAESEGRYIIAIAGYAPAAGHALTAARTQELIKLNQWIKRQQQLRKNFICVSAWDLMTSPINNPADSPASLFLDPAGAGFHISGGGAKLIGKKLADIFTTMVPAVETCISSVMDCYGQSTLSKNLCDYSLMQGTAGTLGTGVSNDPSPAGGFVAGVATGWQVKRNSGTGAALVSVGPSQDGIGNCQRIIISSETTNGATWEMSMTTTPTARGVAGNKYSMRAMIKVSSAINVHTVYGRMLMVVGGTSYQSRDMSPQASNTGSITDATGWQGMLETDPLILPAGSLTNFGPQVLIVLNNPGSITLDVWRVSLDLRDTDL